MRLTSGQKAARTKRERYGDAGLTEIARQAYETRVRRRGARLSELDRHIARVAAGARNRAKRQGWACHEDLAGWALAVIEAQSHRCALSGVSFDLEVHGHGRAPRPFAPSIDRINATEGYVEGNIRIICWAANCLLGTWGDDAAIKIARGISKKQK